MTEPVKTVKIGGVEYLAGQVKNSKTQDSIYTDNSGNLKSKSIYSVELSDGTKLTYEEQAPERDARVVQEKSWTNFFGLEQAKIEDTPKNDGYGLYGCNACEVKADRWHAEGIIFKDVVSNDRDNVFIKHRKMNDGTIQESKNNSINLCDREICTDMTKETGNYNNKLNRKK